MIKKYLLSMYQKERNGEPDSINQMLDFLQKKYIAGEITIEQYKEYYSYLHNLGAISAYETTKDLTKIK